MVDDDDEDDDDVNTNLIIFEYLLSNIPFQLSSQKCLRDPSPKHG